MLRRWLRFVSRLLRHRWREDTHHAVPRDMRTRLAERVARGEQRHGGELRVCIESGLPTSYLLRDATPRERALSLFGKLRVWDTEQNNGVLLYVLLAEQAIEIVADRDIARRVPAQAWQHIVGTLQEACREDRFEEGLMQAIDAISSLLQAHYPLGPGERPVNELPDAPVVR